METFIINSISLSPCEVKELLKWLAKMLINELCDPIFPCKITPVNTFDTHILFGQDDLSD